MLKYIAVTPKDSLMKESLEITTKASFLSCAIYCNALYIKAGGSVPLGTLPYKQWILPQQ